MSIRPPLVHPWNVTPTEAREIQVRLRQHVNVGPLERAPQVIAGVDVHVTGHWSRAAAVLVTYPGLCPIRAKAAEGPVRFPYVPGLLTFREGAVTLAAVEQLEESPDVIIFDAQGMAHPRRMGLATHLGVLLDVPAVGCAKSWLCGAYTEPAEKRGSWSPLVENGETIGAAVRTRDRVRPVFVSVGHRVDLETAVELVLGCAVRYRLPEPTRWAHRVAGGADLPGRGGVPSSGH